MLGLGLETGVRMHFLLRKGLIGFCVAFFGFENNDRMNICFGLRYLVHCLAWKIAEWCPRASSGRSLSQAGRCRATGKSGRRHGLGPNKLTLKRNASPPPRDFWLGHLHSPNSKLGNDLLILNHRITTDASFEPHPPTFTMSLNTGGTPDSEVS